ncbi:MAG: CoA transferase [Rhodospirillaceae bacterium]|jgi:crotonobetainyl-CoA:carnitine CoA-transferase CaiB-like acyl-CoA transferase|nr:CoA transferase [Rhodospirillaceae bacterium]MBT5809664.1 CoA transferase [Rhodospirillaceae bacterium]
MSTKPPLEGIRVLDIGTLIAGPFGATLLGDFGAEIIKVEQPGPGDALRGTPKDGEAGRPTGWRVDARNKKSVTLNLRVRQGQEILYELVRTADIVIENFTPGTLEKWNVGWEDLRKVNPRLIMVRVSGYGQTGPYSKRAGYDRIALGFSGYMYPTGFPDRFPVRPAFPTADYNTGTFGAYAAMLALYERDARGGEGQMIDLALYEPPFRITSNLLANYNATGEIRERIGNRNPTFAPAGTFETKDGRYVQIAAGGQKVFQRLVEAMGMPELADDPRYSVSRERIARADELEQILADWIGERNFAEIEERLVGGNVPFGGIYTPADIAVDPHYQARDSFITVEDPEDGPMAMPGVIPKLMGTPGKVTSTGPKLGQHNDEIYKGLLDKSADELAKLSKDGII